MLAYDDAEFELTEAPRSKADKAAPVAAMPRRLFMDPSGRHLLATMTNGDVHYLHASWRKPKRLDLVRVNGSEWGDG